MTLTERIARGYRELTMSEDVEGQPLHEHDTGIVRVRVVQTGLLRAKNVLVRPIDKDGETDADAAVFVVPGRYVKKQEQ